MDRNEINALTGIERVAIVLLSISEEGATKIFSLMNEEEIKEISQAMSSLGSVKQEIIDKLLLEFNGEMSSSVNFVGNFETTERLLTKILPSDRVSAILEEIKGPAGKNTWDKLGNVNEEVLASYLKNEYPQTIALIVSKMTPTHAAKVLTMLPEEITFDVISRVIHMDSVKKEVLDNIEKTLRAEFISTFSKTQKHDNNMMMAEIFNNLDRSSEAKFMEMLETKFPDKADKIKKLMFTFNDIVNVQPAGIQIILRVVDRTALTVALKGASQIIKDLFLNNMSQRAAKILEEELASLGPVRLKDVDEAQASIIVKIKELAAKGEITIADANAKDEFVY
jgi:flagellar motor switch protein FliG